jgi:hypothetical protein
LSFPAGKHDDQVNVMGLFGRMLDAMYPPEQRDRARERELMIALKRRVL